MSQGTNKLNIGDKSAINNHSQEILAVVAVLELQLAEAEHAVTAMKLKVASMELNYASASSCSASCTAGHPVANAAPSYASALKLPKGQQPMAISANKGPVLVFYPNDQGTIKSSEETKQELQKVVNPGEMGIAVTGVRKVGNSGVVVRTANGSAAQKLKDAAPASPRISEPKQKLPLVALRNLRNDPTPEALLAALNNVNLCDDPDWPMEKFRASCKVAFKKGRQGLSRTTVILECTNPLRDKLISMGTVLIGWDEAKVYDYLRVTCCNKCQQYGHPEKYCRAESMICI